jgi:hypothetical protein
VDTDGDGVAELVMMPRNVWNKGVSLSSSGMDRRGRRKLPDFEYLLFNDESSTLGRLHWAAADRLVVELPGVNGSCAGEVQFSYGLRSELFFTQVVVRMPV